MRYNDSNQTTCWNDPVPADPENFQQLTAKIELYPFQQISVSMPTTPNKKVGVNVYQQYNSWSEVQKIIEGE